MPKLKGPLFSISAHGTLKGVVTFEDGISGPRAQKVPRHRDMQTVAQLAHRTSFTSAVSGWNALDAASKSYYETLAKGQGLTGYNFYVRLWLIGVLPGPPPPPEEIVISATIDSHMAKSAPDANEGDWTKFFLADSAPDTQRGVIEFPLSAIPGGVSIISAELGLRYGIELLTSGTGRDVRVYRLTRSDWVEMEVTWNIYKTGSSWSTSGGDYDGAMYATDQMPALYSWLEFDVKVLVEDAIENRSNQLELLVRYLNESQGSPSAAGIDSTEAVEESYRPKVTVVYQA